MPSLVIASFISGERSASLIAALSFATIGCGVPAGASTPAQNSSVRPGSPNSRAVGTSGSRPLRSGLVISSARILPSRMSGSDVEGVGFRTWMRPPRKSGSAAAPPLYGMMNRSAPLSCLNRSATRIAAVPWVAAKLIVPG